MADQTQEKEQPILVAKWLSMLPFVFFIGTLLTLAIIRVGSMALILGATLIGVCVTSLFAKNWGRFWEVFLGGMMTKGAATFTMIFLLVGIFSKMVAKANIAGGVVWFGSALHITGPLFVGLSFIAACILSTGSGSSMATVLTLGPPLFPAGIILGANPFLLAGALVAGANFGDNLAPVSDTTIVSASTQFYSRKDGPAEIGGVVRTRFKYAIIAAGISLVLYLVLGWGGQTLSTAQATKLIAEHSYAKGLLMIIPVAVIIILAVRGTPISTSLALGIFSGAIVALVFGLLTPKDFVYLKDGKKIVGIIPDGVVSMIKQILVLILLMGTAKMVMRTGTLDAILNAMSKLAKKPRGSELLMALMSGLVGLFGGFAIMGMALVGPFIDGMGKKMKIHPYRRANIIDAMTTSTAHFIPWSKQLFVLAGFLVAMKSTYSFIPEISTFAFFYYCFHCWILPIVMIVSILLDTVGPMKVEAEGFSRAPLPIRHPRRRWKRLSDVEDLS